MPNPPLNYRKAVYAGSFDPATNGHMYIIQRASQLFEEVVVAVGVNPAKRPAFTSDQRVAMLAKCVAPLANVRVVAFTDEYLVHFAERVGTGVIIRGIRSVIDYEFEHGMRHVNADINPDIHTVFLMPPREMSELSSSFIKGLIGPRGWEDLVQRYVPPPVFAALREWSRSHTSSGPELEGA